MQRRNFVASGLVLGAVLGLPGGLVFAVSSQPSASNLAANSSEFKSLYASFVGKSKVVEDGLRIDLPAIADNPSGVPVGVQVTYPITDSSYCTEVIVLAELNPIPLAGRFRFSPYAGTAEVGMRLRLSQTQTIHALAKMSDGRVLVAKQPITVTTSGCGM